MSDETIGHFEIISFVGRGGMAAVYQAIDPEQKSTVAIKVLSQEYQSDLGFRARFEREAETIARLKHPAIVPLYEHGQHDGKLYIVMAYMPGGSLADRMLQGPLSVGDAASILERVGSALDYAHNLGIVHRDLKPSNILFDQNGDAFLADFGIALHASIFTTDRALLSGTPAYMSPEQARKDKEIDGRSDLYSLGIALFESLTGELPFAGDTPMVTLIKRTQESPPAPREIRPELPPALDALFDRILSIDPAQRYQSGAAFTRAFYRACGLEHPLEEQSEISEEIIAEQNLAKDMSVSKLQAKTSETASLMTPEAEDESESNTLEAGQKWDPLEGLGRRLSDEPVILLILISLLGIISAAIVVGLIRAPTLQRSLLSDATNENDFAPGTRSGERVGLDSMGAVGESSQEADTMLVYNDAAVTLINLSTVPLSIDNLLIKPITGGNDQEPTLSTGLWDELAKQSGDTLSPGACYQLLRRQGGQALPSPEPVPLPNCDLLQGWLVVDDEDWIFWRLDNTDEEFQVLQGDNVIKTCSLEDGFCVFHIPRS